MKINWGTGLVIGMVAFISFIMYFVVTMMTSKDFDHDLVVEDYYKAELHYQQDIDAEENALALDGNIKIVNEGSKIVLKFPENMNLDQIEGAVSFYRPSNKKLDFKILFSEITDKNFVIPESQLVKGRWNIKVNWQKSGKEYLYKEEITY